MKKMIYSVAVCLAFSCKVKHINSAMITKCQFYDTTLKMKMADRIKFSTINPFLVQVVKKTTSEVDIIITNNGNCNFFLGNNIYWSSVDQNKWSELHAPDFHTKNNLLLLNPGQKVTLSCETSEKAEFFYFSGFIIKGIEANKSNIENIETTYEEGIKSYSISFKNNTFQELVWFKIQDFNLIGNNKDSVSLIIYNDSTAH
jgi:hypothetical protein